MVDRGLHASTAAPNLPGRVNATIGTSVLRLTAQKAERSHKMIRDRLRHMADLVLILWRALVILTSWT